MKKTAEKLVCLDSYKLHLIAMLLMLCDHIWAAIIPGNMWLTNLGRASFPIFAFLTAEGAVHTGNKKAYLRRLFDLALISEIPFNLMYTGYIIYPFHQNVIWTLLLALCAIFLYEKAAAKLSFLPSALVFIGSVCLFSLLAVVLMTDYHAYGVMTVLMFYLMRKITLPSQFLRLSVTAILLYLIHGILFKGMLIDVTFLGKTMEIPQQGLAVLSMLPISLYNGKPGRKDKAARLFTYSFYPLHMLIIVLFALYIL